MEDAALLHPDSGPTLAFTVDFITPIVDDPETYGAIAAANALSDVYATSRKRAWHQLVRGETSNTQRPIHV